MTARSTEKGGMMKKMVMYVAEDGKAFSTESMCKEYECKKNEDAKKQKLVDDYNCTLKAINEIKHGGPYSCLYDIEAKLLKAKKDLMDSSNYGRMKCIPKSEWLLSKSDKIRLYSYALNDMAKKVEAYRKLREKLNDLGLKLGYSIPVLKHHKKKV